MFTKLIRQAGVLLSGNLVAALLNFFSVAISLKALGVEAFGVVTVLQGYVLVISLCANPQAWQGLIRSLNLESDKSTLITTTFSYDLLCALTGMVVALLGASFYLQFFDLSEYSTALQIACVYVFINQTSVAIGLLRYHEKFNQLALQSVIAAVLFFSFSCYGWSQQHGIEYFVLSYLFSLSCGVLYIQARSLPLALQAIKTAKTQQTEALDKKAFKKFIYGVHLTSLADIPVKQLDNILVGAFVSVGAAGAYRVIKQIATITTKLTGPFNQVLYPEINRLLAEKNYSQVKQAMFKIITVLGFVSFTIAALASATSFIWVPAIFSQDLMTYQWHIVVFLFVHGAVTAFMPINPIFLALGYVKRLFTITLLANLVLTCAIVLLGPVLGLWGVITAISLQYLITVFGKLPLILKRLSLEINESSTLRT